MKVELHLHPDQTEPKIVIYAARETEELRRLVETLEKTHISPILGQQGERTVPLSPGDILRFYADGKGVVAQTAGGEYQVKLRLYELEERLDPHTFVRISNSEIANLKKVTALDMSLTGTIRMTLGENLTTYVSRRYVKKIKQAIGL